MTKPLLPIVLIVLIIDPIPTFAVERDVIVAQQDRIDVIQRVAPSVVAIFGGEGDGGGSGVLITADGYALSNFHVTSAVGEFMKCGLNDGRLYDAVIVGIDPTGDVALIKLLGRDDFPFATMGDSDDLRVGDWTYAMGNPFLLATDFQPTVTAGIISGLHRYQYPSGTLLEYTDCIQVDTSINPGNSGGPLFNTKGELVGINGRISVEKRGRVNIGAGYAISINQIKHFLDDLKAGRIVDHATLGATVRTGVDRQVLIDGILEHSDAYRRGLRENDELVSFAGRPIGSVNQFKNILGIYPDRWSLPLVFRRDGQKHEIMVELRPLHRSTELKRAVAMNPLKPQRQKPEPKHPELKGPDDESDIAKLPADELPDEFKKMYVAKSGFANYYFNELEQRRVLQGLESLKAWLNSNDRWKMSGKTTAGDRFTLTATEKGLGLELLNRPGLQTFEEQIQYLDEPPGSGGLLPAVHQWKLLLTAGPESFTELVYLGSQPLDGNGTSVDVLQSRRSGASCRWFFSKESGLLVGFDTRLSTDVDSCRIRFQEWGQFEGRPFPSRWQVRSGDVEFAVFVIETFEATKGPLSDASGGTN